MSITQLVDLYWIWRPEQYWNSGYKHLLEKHYCMKKTLDVFLIFDVLFSLSLKATEMTQAKESYWIWQTAKQSSSCWWLILLCTAVPKKTCLIIWLQSFTVTFTGHPGAALAKSCHPWVYFPYPIKWKLTAHLFGAMGSRTCCLWCHNNVIGSISEHSHTAINRLISFRCTNELRCAFY